MTAEQIVDALEKCGGDIELFANQFPDLPKETVITRALVVLNDPSNSKQRNRWDGLTDAFKEAKILVAEQNAIAFISKYQPDQSGHDRPTLAQVTSMARFWLSGHTAAQTTRARKEAGAAQSSAEMQELDEIYADLIGSD